MFKFVSPIFLISLCKLVLGQDPYSVFLVEFPRGFLNTTVIRCPATIITDRHVLTTAACATPTNSSFELAIRISISFAGGGASRTVPADQSFIHPNFTGDVYSNNVAVVRMAGTFNTTTLPPFVLGSIPSPNTTCSLFAWGGAHDDAYVNVVALGPEYCYSNQPQIYCTEHYPQTAEPCTARTGAPLVCSTGSVDGLLLQTGCQEESPGRYLQPYHSISEYKEWIESVSGAELIANQISTLLLLSALVICLKNTA